MPRTKKISNQRYHRSVGIEQIAADGVIHEITIKLCEDIWPVVSQHWCDEKKKESIALKGELPEFLHKMIAVQWDHRISQSDVKKVVVGVHKDNSLFSQILSEPECLKGINLILDYYEPALREKKIAYNASQRGDSPVTNKMDGGQLVLYRRSAALYEMLGMSPYGSHNINAKRACCATGLERQRLIHCIVFSMLANPGNLRAGLKGAIELRSKDHYHTYATADGLAYAEYIKNTKRKEADFSMKNSQWYALDGSLVDAKESEDVAKEQPIAPQAKLQRQLSDGSLTVLSEEIGHVSSMEYLKIYKSHLPKGPVDLDDSVRSLIVDRKGFICILKKPFGDRGILSPPVKLKTLDEMRVDEAVDDYNILQAPFILEKGQKWFLRPDGSLFACDLITRKTISIPRHLFSKELILPGGFRLVPDSSDVQVVSKRKVTLGVTKAVTTASVANSLGAPTWKDKIKLTSLSSSSLFSQSLITHDVAQPRMYSCCEAAERESKIPASMDMTTTNITPSLTDYLLSPVMREVSPESPLSSSKCMTVADHFSLIDHCVSVNTTTSLSFSNNNVTHMSASTLSSGCRQQRLPSVDSEKSSAPKKEKPSVALPLPQDISLDEKPVKKLLKKPQRWRESNSLKDSSAKLSASSSHVTACCNEGGVTTVVHLKDKKKGPSAKTLRKRRKRNRRKMKKLQEKNTQQKQVSVRQIDDAKQKSITCKQTLKGLFFCGTFSALSYGLNTLMNSAQSGEVPGMDNMTDFTMRS